MIAIAGAAQQAHDDHQTMLVIFGLLVSVPFIVFGSQVVLRLIDRFPIIVWLGGGLLGWIGGGMVPTDGFVVKYLPDASYISLSRCCCRYCLPFCSVGFLRSVIRPRLKMGTSCS